MLDALENPNHNGDKGANSEGTIKAAIKTRTAGMVMRLSAAKKDQTSKIIKIANPVSRARFFVFHSCHRVV